MSDTGMRAPLLHCRCSNALRQQFGMQQPTRAPSHIIDHPFDTLIKDPCDRSGKEIRASRHVRGAALGAVGGMRRSTDMQSTSAVCVNQIHQHGGTVPVRDVHTGCHLVHGHPLSSLHRSTTPPSGPLGSVPPCSCCTSKRCCVASRGNVHLVHVQARGGFHRRHASLVAAACD